LRTALWTDQGVDIEGRRQRGELVPWSNALRGLGSHALDVAIQELDWDTVHAVGLPPASYPLAAITNLCVNNDSCLVHEETMRAVRAMGAIRASVHPAGALVLNGDDFGIADGDDAPTPERILYGSSPDTPLIRRQVRRGGVAAWEADGGLWIGDAAEAEWLVPIGELRLALGGAASFQIMNALAAAAIAHACGIPTATVAGALASVVPDPALAPGSFNVLTVRGATVVVDRPAHPWFLRPALRALGHLRSGRIIRVVGRLDSIDAADLVETGRLLGRGGGAILLHGERLDPERAELLRQGIAANDVPPLVIHAAGERAAISALLRMLKPDDLAYILADRPLPVVRALQRAENRAAA
jgi:cyanophycin synthetase